MHHDHDDAEWAADEELILAAMPRVAAAADVIELAGGSHVTLAAGDPASDRRWDAAASGPGGNRIAAGGYPGPAEAAEALALMIVSGTMCRCGKRAWLALAGTGTAAPDGACAWQRTEHGWHPGCPDQRGERLRIRLLVDGQVRDETWIGTDPADVDATARKHQDRAQAASDAGLPWLVEIYDPASPPDEAYSRFGTDTARMTMPVKLDGIGEGIRHDAKAGPHGSDRG